MKKQLYSALPTFEMIHELWNENSAILKAFGDTRKVVSSCPALEECKVQIFAGFIRSGKVRGKRVFLLCSGKVREACSGRTK